MPRTPSTSHTPHASLLLALATPLAALAQPLTQSFAWAENTGWINFAPANALAGPNGERPGMDLALVAAREFLLGSVWSENAGWITLGNGSGPYTNTTGPTHGVNIQPTGDLAGFAWAENLGWINFSPSPDQLAAGLHARATYNRLFGFAWSENAGWINLGTPTSAPGTFVTIPNPADTNRDGLKNIFDILRFFELFGSGSSRADVDANTTLNIFDILGFFRDFGS